MRTPMEEPKSFVSIGAPELPPHVATSVLVTSTSAQEQRRMLEAMTRKDFIICNADRTGPVLSGQGQIVPLCDATLVPFAGENEPAKPVPCLDQLDSCGSRARSPSTRM